MGQFDMEIADFEEETSPPSSIRRGSPGGMTPDRVPVFQGSESKHFRAEFQGSGFTNSSVVFQGSGSTNSGVPEETGQDASTPSTSSCRAQLTLKEEISNRP